MTTVGSDVSPEVKRLFSESGYDYVNPGKFVENSILGKQQGDGPQLLIYEEPPNITLKKVCLWVLTIVAFCCILILLSTLGTSMPCSNGNNDTSRYSPIYDETAILLTQ